MHKKMQQGKENLSDFFQRTSQKINVNAQFEVLTSLHSYVLADIFAGFISI